MKRCSTCGQYKDLGSFDLSKSTKDLHSYSCKVCLRNRHKIYYQLNKIKTNKRDVLRRQIYTRLGKCRSCWEPISKKNKSFCELHRLIDSKYHREYYLKKKGCDQ